MSWIEDTKLIKFFLLIPILTTSNLYSAAFLECNKSGAVNYAWGDKYHKDWVNKTNLLSDFLVVAVEPSEFNKVKIDKGVYKFNKNDGEFDWVWSQIDLDKITLIDKPFDEYIDRKSLDYMKWQNGRFQKPGYKIIGKCKTYSEIDFLNKIKKDINTKEQGNQI